MALARAQSSSRRAVCVRTLCGPCWRSADPAPSRTAPASWRRRPRACARRATAPSPFSNACACSPSPAFTVRRRNPPQARGVSDTDGTAAVLAQAMANPDAHDGDGGDGDGGDDGGGGGGGDGGGGDDGTAQAAAALQALEINDVDAVIVRGLFQQGQLVEARDMATGVWKAGRITHQHKDGRYTVTYKDDAKPQDEQVREKKIHPNRIREDKGALQETGERQTEVGLSSKEKKARANLRLLDQLEANDKKESTTAKAAAKAEAHKIKQQANTKPLSEEVVLTVTEVGKPGNKKAIKLSRQGKGGGLAGLLKAAKQKFNAKKGFKVVVVADTLEQLLSLDYVQDQESVMVAAKAPKGMQASTDPAPGHGASQASGGGAPASADGAAPSATSTLAPTPSETAPPLATESSISRLRKAYATTGRSREPPSAAETKAESERLAAALEDLRQSTDAKFLKIKGQRERLPACKMVREVVDAIATHQVVVISGSTGCGKTTQVPQFILDDAIAKGTGGTCRCPCPAFLRESRPTRVASARAVRAARPVHAVCAARPQRLSVPRLVLAVRARLPACPPVCRVLCTQPRRISAVGVAERVASERNESIGNSVGYTIRLESRQSPRTRIHFMTTGPFDFTTRRRACFGRSRPTQK